MENQDISQSSMDQPRRSFLAQAMASAGLLALAPGKVLAVHTMQSFANFTVGGAVSVNAHGR